MAVLEEEKRAVLSVLDGTTTKMPCRELSLAKTKKHWEFDSTPERFFLYRQLTQDVWVSSVKELDAAAGDVVHMINVQCFQKPAVSQSAVSAVEEPVELRITEHQGKIVHLDEDSEEAFKLKESIPTVLSALPAWSYQTVVADDDIVVTTIINESAPFATLEEIQEASQQGEYLVDAEVVRVRPGSLDAVCVPLCPSCREEELTVQIEGGRCKNDGTILEYELNFALNLKDESGELEVLVSGQESRKLFSKILTDDNFAATQENKGKVLKAFFALTGGNDPFMALPFDPRYCYTRPKLQYAIKKIFDHCTASVGEHSCEYHMVDTVVDLAPQG